MKKIIILSVLTTGLLFASNGDKLVEENGCMGCHNIMGKKVAPAFMGIARKNIRFYGDDAKIHIIKSIKDGSQGKYPKFSYTAMPAFSNLSQTDLTTIANWIFEQYDKNKSMMKNHQGQGQGKSRGQGKNMGMKSF